MLRESMEGTAVVPRQRAWKWSLAPFPPLDFGEALQNRLTPHPPFPPVPRAIFLRPGNPPAPSELPAHEWMTSSKHAADGQRWLGPGPRALWPHVKLLAPGVAAALVLTALTVTRPVIEGIGPQAFLIVPNLYLFVYPGKVSIGQHFESVCLCLLGGFLGLGISFLAVCGNVWIQGEGIAEYTNPRGRAVSVCTLLALTFIGGWASSSYPRFRVAARALLLYASWVLTTGATRITYDLVSGYWYGLCVTAGVSFLAKLTVFPTTASRSVNTLLDENLGATCDFINLAMQDFFGGSAETSEKLRSARSRLSATVTKLPGAFEQASHEFHQGRVAMSTYHDLAGPMKRIKGWTAAGMGIPSLTESAEHGQHSHQPGKDGQIKQDCGTNGTEVESEADLPSPSSVFQPHVTALAQEVERSFRMVQNVIELIKASEKFDLLVWLGFRQEAGLWGKASLPGIRDASSMSLPAPALVQQRQRLSEAISAFRHSLEAALESLRTEQSQVGPNFHTHTGKATNLWEDSMYETAFFMVSMSEISREAERCLMASQRHVSIWQANPHRRLFRPAVRWSKWLVRSGYADADEPNLLSEEEGVSRASALAGAESEGELFRRIFTDGDRIKSQSTPHLPHRSNVMRRLWRTPDVVKARLAASFFILSLRRNRHARFGMKLAIGVVLLSIPAWIPKARTWYGPQRGVWSLLSYIWVFEATSAATFRLASLRLFGTIAGVLLGLVAFEISRRNPYALTFVQTLFLIPSAYFIMESKYPALGLIIGAALSLVTGVAYVTPLVPSGESSTASAPTVALTRGCEVVVGIVAAVIINLTLWPYHARVECVATLSEASTKMNLFYTSLARQMLQAGLIATDSIHEQFEKMEMALVKRLAFARTLIEVMSAEVSLVVKPIAELTSIAGHLDNIVSLLSALRQCRERGLQTNHTAAVLSAFHERQNVVSSVSLSFWAVAQALATKAPLPQFLPSPRAALNALTFALQEALANEEIKRSELPGTSQHVPGGEKYVPQAYYALMKAGEHMQWRGRNGSPSRSGTSTPLRSQQHSQSKATPRPASHAPRTPQDVHSVPSPRTPRDGICHSNRARFWVMAEQSLLAHIVTEIEHLLDETRNLYGEVTFVAVEEAAEEALLHQQRGRDSAMASTRNSMSEVATASSATPGTRGRRATAGHEEHRRPQQHFVSQMDPLTETLTRSSQAGQGSV